MFLENVANSYLTLITLISFLVFLMINKLSLNRIFNLFLDEDYNKPQAFHKSSTPRVGGLASIISLTVLFFSYDFFFKTQVNDYIFFSLIFFFLGFIDDIKISLKPSIRLIIMIVVIPISISLFDITISLTGFRILNDWLENSFFNYIFVTLCFLFIINGCNLIDGFNGLLIIHLIIINSVFLFLNLIGNNLEYSYFLIGQIFVMFCFLLFNFPNAKMFLGDGGAYLFGALTSLNAIKTSINFTEISPIFFATLLSYIFFEVFFSFFRKLRNKASPLKPDSSHLHMLLFKNISQKFTRYPNPMTSIIINFSFLILIMPLIFYRHDGWICKIIFLFMTICYLYFYNFLSKKQNFTSNENN